MTMPTNSSSSSGARGVLAVGVGTAVAAGAAMAALALTRKIRAADGPPAASEWRPVGRLAELYCFPLKSGKAMAVDALEASTTGLRRGLLRDRVFVAVNRDGRFVTARSHPRLVHVRVAVRGEVFEFQQADAAGASSATLVVEPASLQASARKKIRVWGSTITAVDCGDEAAAWIRRAVVEPAQHGEATADADLRLMYYPVEQTDRNGAAGELGIYSDQTSYHIVTRSSLDSLNGKLGPGAAVSALNFRPNFVVDDGPSAFEEDGWSWVRIGDKAVFRVVMPCGRCVMTTVDPETGVKSVESEPLRTLRTFRKPDEAQKKKMGDDCPMFGLRLGVHVGGPVAVGDAVYVAP